MLSRTVLGHCLLPLGGELAGGHELDTDGGGTACGAWRSHHHRLSHVSPDLDFAFAFPGQGPRVIPPDLTDPVQTHFDGFPVQHAVAVVDPLPRADETQLGCGDRGLDAEAVEVFKVIIGNESRVAAGRGVRRGEDLKIVGCPCHYAFLAVERLASRHEDKAGGLRVLSVVRGLVAVHRRSLSREQRCLMADSLTNAPGHG
jgi:hypothetical protein